MKNKRICEVCNKYKAYIGCQDCKKWICNKCYGTFSISRKCCGREA